MLLFLQSCKITDPIGTKKTTSELKSSSSSIRTNTDQIKTLGNKIESMIAVTEKLTGIIVGLDRNVVTLNGNTVALNGNVITLNGNVIELDKNVKLLISKIINLSNLLDAVNSALDRVNSTLGLVNSSLVDMGLILEKLLEIKKELDAMVDEFKANLEPDTLANMQRSLKELVDIAPEMVEMSRELMRMAYECQVIVLKHAFVVPGDGQTEFQGQTLNETITIKGKYEEPDKTYYVLTHATRRSLGTDAATYVKNVTRPGSTCDLDFKHMKQNINEYVDNSWFGWLIKDFE